MSPFQSKKQWAWAFSQGKTWAKAWAAKTSSYKRLPRRKGKARGKRRS